MKENGFTLKEAKSRRYPSEIIMDADYVDDLALLENTPAQAEYLVQCLERVTGSRRHRSLHELR